MTRDPLEKDRVEPRSAGPAAPGGDGPRPPSPAPPGGDEPRPPGPAPPGGDEPPPVLGTWPRLYALVLAVLVLVIAFCFWLSRLGS